jgi:hypothetical protein
MVQVIQLSCGQFLMAFHFLSVVAMGLEVSLRLLVSVCQFHVSVPWKTALPIWYWGLARLYSSSDYWNQWRLHFSLCLVRKHFS